MFRAAESNTDNICTLCPQKTKRNGFCPQHHLTLLTKFDFIIAKCYNAFQSSLEVFLFSKSLRLFKEFYEIN